MKIFAPIAVAFGMFSRIPMPVVDWNEKNMRYAMAAVPLVGVVQGVISLAWGLFSLCLSLPASLSALGFTLLPLAVNGGIHLDGLCDTVDALASHASREKKLEILADPHTGAFGVMALVCYLLAMFVLFLNFNFGNDKYFLRNLLTLGILYILSRSVSSYSVVAWPAAKPDGIVSGFHTRSASGKASLLLMIQILLCGVGLVHLQKRVGVGMLAVASMTLLYYRNMAMKSFGGVSGDLAGWFLQMLELGMLTVLVVGGLI
jgi:Cobalamin-5-phosphate synthase